MDTLDASILPVRQAWNNGLICFHLIWQMQVKRLQGAPEAGHVSVVGFLHGTVSTREAKFR